MAERPDRPSSADRPSSSDGNPYQGPARVPSDDVWPVTDGSDVGGAEPARTATDADDCVLPVSVQNHNIRCFVAFWCIVYLAAPVSYIGTTHANLLKAFGNTDFVSNLPSAVYLWLTIVPVLAAWFFPSPRHLRPLALLSVTLLVLVTGLVAVTLSSGASAEVSTAVVILHGAVFGAANGILLTAMWDFLRRGVATSRRGKALGFTFGIGPLFACVGALLQDAMFDGRLLGGRSFGLSFPDNYMGMFAAVSPLLILAGIAVALIRIPPEPPGAGDQVASLATIAAGIRQFVRNRGVFLSIVIYVIVYSGGNSIIQNVSLHAQSILGAESNTLGAQNFLRFGFKALAGAILGWLLAKSSPRATLLATTSILLIGMSWALTSSGTAFMLTFGLLGAGELFGAYFPNYVTTASEKTWVRLNMAYLSLLSALIGFSSIAFGAISDRYGRIASFYAAAGLLGIAIVLILVLLPRDPTPKHRKLTGIGES